MITVLLFALASASFPYTERNRETIRRLSAALGVEAPSKCFTCGRNYPNRTAIVERLRLDGRETEPLSVAPDDFWSLIAELSPRLTALELTRIHNVSFVKQPADGLRSLTARYCTFRGSPPSNALPLSCVITAHRTDRDCATCWNDTACRVFSERNCDVGCELPVRSTSTFSQPQTHLSFLKTRSHSTSSGSQLVPIVSLNVLFSIFLN